MSELWNRLKEPSTYAGLGVLMASFGWMGWTPEDWNTVFMAVAAVSGVMAMVMKDKPKA